MGNDDNGRCIFPLTSLQIGDLQSYLSHLNIFLAAESNTFYILVDNKPWLEGIGSRRAQLWQLMVTKSRLSPFANRRARKGINIVKEKSEKKAKAPTSDECTNSSKSKISERWFSLIDAATLSQKTALLPVDKLKYSLQLNRKLHSTLFGLIIFEVSWDDVRGINYLNELQTDTSLAVETKFMRRWEFDSITQAAGCISSWFAGTDHEQNIMREYLLSTVEEVFYDANEDFVEEETSSLYDVAEGNVSSYGVPVSFSASPTELENDTSILHTPPPPNVPYKRRKVTRYRDSGVEVDTYSEETPKTPKRTFDPFEHCESTIEAAEYKDVLIKFQFNDRDLPFKLKDIIMCNLRLLRLLEYGLPSWVIFLQSYPVFCNLYRPWMCPLVRALYVMISVTTVAIGFYDLYKNVPLLKTTAFRLFEPIFAWIETWGMVSRVKYLGTMLFLHNFQKAFKWLLLVTRTMRSFFSVLARPVIGPLTEFFLPCWTFCIQMSESFFSFVGIVLGLLYSFVDNVVEMVLLPIWSIMSSIWTSAMCVILPTFWNLWEILCVPLHWVFAVLSYIAYVFTSIFWTLRKILCLPFRLVLALYSCITFVFTQIYEMVRELWVSACSIVQIASATEATVSSTYEVSMWRSLWNDLFSKVFRAVKSILQGFVTFFSACNRHRLSIYNHLKELVQKLSRRHNQPHHVNLQHRKKHLDSLRPTQLHSTQKLVKANNIES